MKKITIDEVAVQAGVSKATISRYLNGNFSKMSKATQENIKTVIKNLDYRPNVHAQTLKTKHSGLLGFVIADISNLYSAKLISGATKAARDNNYQLLIMDSNNDLKIEQESIKKLVAQSVEGIVMQPMDKNSDGYQHLDLPVVMADRTSSPKIGPEVIINNYEATKVVGDYIVDQGYDKVVLVSEPISVTQVRQKRYDALADLTKQEELAFELIECNEFDSVEWVTMIKQKISNYVSSDSKAAIFASNSRALMATLQIIGQLKYKIPNQIGICGFDDWNWTSLSNPPITSIEQDSELVGQKAVELLLKIIQKQTSEIDSMVIPAKINIRSSL